MTTIKSFCKCVVPDNVFRESSPPRSLEEKQLRAKRTFEEMMSYIPGMQPAVSYPDFCPRSTSETSCAAHVRHVKLIDIYLSDFLGKCMGEEAKYEGICLLFDGLQQPILNKQVGKLKDGRRKQTCMSGRVCWRRFTSDPLLGKGAHGHLMSPSLSTVCFRFVFVFSPLAQLTYVLLDIAIQELFPELNRVNPRTLSFP